LPPVELCTQDKAVQSIGLGSAFEHCRETFFKRDLDGSKIEIGAGLVSQVKVLDPERIARLQRQFIGVLCVDDDAHIFEQGQHFGQFDRFAVAVQHEVHVAGQTVCRLVQVDRLPFAVSKHRLNLANIATGFLWTDVFLVAQRKHIPILAKHLQAFVRAAFQRQLITQSIRPGDNYIGQSLLDFLNADARPVARDSVNNNVYASEC